MLKWFRLVHELDITCVSNVSDMGEDQRGKWVTVTRERHNKENENYIK